MRSNAALRVTLALLVLLAFHSDHASAARPKRSESGRVQSSEAAKGEEIDAEDAKGGLRYSIQVVKFEDKSGWAPSSGKWHLTSAWSEMLTAQLAENEHFIVIAERDMREEARKEENFNESEWAQKGSERAPEKGHMSPAQLIVKGTIVGAQQNTGGGSGTFNFGGRSINLDSKESSILMIVQVVDAQTAQVLASADALGTAGKKSFSVRNLLPSVPGINMWGDDPMVRACYNALGKAVDTCIEALDKLQWRAKVLDVSPENEVTINRGNREGIKEGRALCFGTGKEMTDPDTGESLGYRFKESGRLEIVSVEEKMSIGRIVSGGPATNDMMVWLPK